MERMKREIEKSEWEKEVVYNTVYLPVRFFKKEAYIRIDDYKEVRDKREKVVEGLEEENKELKEWKENLIRADKKKSDHIDELEEENKNLKSDLAFEKTMLDNVKAEYESSQEIIKKLKEERIFSLGEYDYMILTSTTPQLKVYRKENSGDVFTK